MIGEWVADVEKELDWGEVEWEAWDGVEGGTLPLGEAKAARKEEVMYMQGRRIWCLRLTKECWEKIGKAPVSIRRVDTNEGAAEERDMRRRLVPQVSKLGIGTERFWEQRTCRIC